MEIVLKEIKNKKASGRYGWKAESIKNGGKELSKSLTVLYNRIEKEKCVPEEWGHITTKSVRKNGKEKINENQRGLFLMNIVAKVYEKVKKRQNEKIHSNMSQMQTAGRKQRSTMDNILIVS